jgi:hypothetical protein
VPQLSGVTTVEVTDAPARVEYVVWSRADRTPAATAFLALLDIPDAPGTVTGHVPVKTGDAAACGQLR